MCEIIKSQTRRANRAVLTKLKELVRVTLAGIQIHLCNKYGNLINNTRF